MPREMPEHVKMAVVSDLTANLKRLLGVPNICGKRWVWQQYDSMVLTNTVEGPGAGDAGRDSHQRFATRAGHGARW